MLNFGTIYRVTKTPSSGHEIKEGVHKMYTRRVCVYVWL